MTARIALGIVARTGWAVAVALSGSAEKPVFAGRWPIELVPDDLPRQPYHAAADLGHVEGAEIVRQVERAAGQSAAEALQSTVTALGGVTVIGLLVKPEAQAPESLADVLSSHVAIHTAEGELYREALLSASESLSAPVLAITADMLPLADEQVRALGVVAGRPWRREEKDAARCALVALRAPGRARSS